MSTSTSPRHFLADSTFSILRFFDQFIDDSPAHLVRSPALRLRNVNRELATLSPVFLGSRWEITPATKSSTLLPISLVLYLPYSHYLLSMALVLLSSRSLLRSIFEFDSLTRSSLQNNCGSQLNVCPTSYANGLGSVCLAGVCQPTRCAAGFAFNFTTKTCQNVSVDEANCGAIGVVCSFPRGTGQCLGGVCTLQTCSSGFTAVNGVCTAVNTATDIVRLSTPSLLLHGR